MPTFDTPEPISLTLELTVGDVRIVASERTDTVVEVHPGDPARPSDVAAAERTRVDYANGVLQIKAPRGWRRSSLRGGESIEVRIDLPAGSTLHGTAGLATLRCAGTLGDCRYQSGGGDITIEHIAGVGELTTATGTVRVERVAGPMTVKNAHGDTWIGEVVGDLQVRAANGKVAVGQAHAAVSAKTANGDIRLAHVTGGVIVAETARGAVDVAVRGGVAAWLDLHTALGQVHNLLEPGGQPGPAENTVQVRARSAFGDITVRRADQGDSGRGAA